jgi:DNA-directed RNA polymerase specialized sigma24 family protein
MSSDENRFTTLMQQIREGSEAATRDLVVNYGSHLLRVVRRSLNKSLRSKFDSQDFVQAVWASFFAFEPQRIAFEGPNDLVAFLTNMARNKVVEAVRQRLQTQRYNVNRERALDHSGLARTKDLVAEQPSPDEIAIAREEWERFLASQTPEHLGIIERLVDGQDRLDIARDLGLNEKTIRRVARKLSPRPLSDVN